MRSTKRTLTATAGAAVLACAATQLAVPSAAQVTGRAHRIRAAAALESWGNNFSGQLGTGAPLRTTATTPAPVKLPADMTPTAVAAGSTFAFAAGPGGAVCAWGDNLHGQLATGRVGQPSPVPVKVSLPDGVSALSVAAGDSSAYVIGSDGKLYDWGNNKSGQLGIGSTKSRYQPGTVELPDGARPEVIAAGQFSAYALGSNGVLYSWGRNDAGQLGNNSTTTSTTPVRVALPSDVTPVKIAAGLSDAYVLASNGTVYAWGDDQVGQLGNTMVKYRSLTPVPVFLPSGVTPAALASGRNSAYVLTKDGLLYAWGDNGEGQLGDGTRDNRFLPVRVSLPPGVQPVQLAAGAISAYAMGATGKLYAWGNNVFGQLGNGTTQGVLVPTFIPLPAGVAAAALVPESGSTSAYLITAPGGRKRPASATSRSRSPGSTRAGSG
ncbi:MAG TPA: hypothetical protein VH480_09560 [Streptosporangiaceae bacterium]